MDSTTTLTVGWVATAAFLVGFLTKLLKSDGLTTAVKNLGLPAIPKRAVPWLALGLGIASSALDNVLMGTAWSEALVKGFVAGVTAIAGHEAGIESLRKGKELLVLAVLLTVGTSGCHLLTRQNAKTALDAVSIACIATTALTNEAEVAKACELADDLLPVIRNLIGQREAAKRSGYAWPGSDTGAPDAGLDGSP